MHQAVCYILFVVTGQINDGGDGPPPSTAIQTQDVFADLLRFVQFVDTNMTSCWLPLYPSSLSLYLISWSNLHAYPSLSGHILCLFSYRKDTKSAMCLILNLIFVSLFVVLFSYVVLEKAFTEIFDYCTFFIDTWSFYFLSVSFLPSLLPFCVCIHVCM